MSKNNNIEPNDYIVPLNMNGLQGRMLRLPPRRNKTKEILVVYGHHSTIERWQALAQDLNKYGAVTMPDLPGFGGMASLYRIGVQPDLDKLADYMAAFVKLLYKRRRVSIVGIGFGFVVITRMLQRYPDLAKKVDLLISFGGFTHRDDFALSHGLKGWYSLNARFWRMHLPALVLRYTYLQPALFHYLYKTSGPIRRSSFYIMTQPCAADVEIDMWHANDVRSHMQTVLSMLSVDNCRLPLDVPVWHLPLADKTFLDEHLVAQHMQVTFKNYNESKQKPKPARPDSDGSNLVKLIPPKLRRILAKS